MKQSVQISESIRLGILLAFSGGFMDAYSYIERGHVFANAQTGNMLLFGVHLSEGHFTAAMHYFFPVFAFALGIALAELVRIMAPRFFHWRQTAVLLEAVILVCVGFFPQTMNLPANVLTSFACGIQVESFRKIRGNGVATTMCIGNLRSATQNLFDFLHKKEKRALQGALLYFGIILCFILGAVGGNAVIRLTGEKAIWGCSFLLFSAFFFMFIDRERRKK